MQSAISYAAGAAPSAWALACTPAERWAEILAWPSALQSGKLQEVLPQWRSVGAFGEKLYAIRPYATHVPRAVAVFVAWLRETLAEGFDA